MPTTHQDTVPVDGATFRRVLENIQAPYDHEVVENEAGCHLFVRVPADEPDAVAHLERAAESFPSWAVGRLTAVYLVGRRRTVHVPGYSAIPLLRDRLRADSLQAADLRRRLKESYDAVTFRSEGDPFALLRFAVRLPREQVADLTDEDLDGMAFAAGTILDSRRHDTVDAVLLVADKDHLRLNPRDFFDDLAPRWQKSRKRPERDPQPRPSDAAPPAPETGFPGPRYAVRPVAPPRRHVDTVEPVLEIEDEVDAKPADPSALLARIDAKRLDLGSRVVVRILRMAGYTVVENVWRGRAQYIAAAERPHKQPRRVAVRTFATLSRRDVDGLVVDARGLGADLLIGITPHPDAKTIRRAQGTRVRVMRPEDVAGLQF